MPDPRALKILFDTYWSPRGWKQPAETSPEDFAFARAAGVMFDPLRRAHDQLVTEAIELRTNHSLDSVTSAFVASLSSHRLDWRSALGSWSLLAHLRPHPFVEHPGSASCACCGLAREQDVDPNVLSFERFKWGGVRHLDVSYAVFDLSRLAAEPAAAPSAEDVDVLRSLLDALRSAPRTESASKLVGRLTKAKLPHGSKDERSTLVDLLGIAGVLRVPDRLGFLARFTSHDERELPSHHFVDRAFPGFWWRGADGIDEAQVVDLFGRHLRP
jgi:hypothetical protein